MSEGVKNNGEGSRSLEVHGEEGGYVVWPRRENICIYIYIYIVCGLVAEM